LVSNETEVIGPAVSGLCCSVVWTDVIEMSQGSCNGSQGEQLLSRLVEKRLFTLLMGCNIMLTCRPCGDGDSSISLTYIVCSEAAPKYVA